MLMFKCLATHITFVGSIIGSGSGGVVVVVIVCVGGGVGRRGDIIQAMIIFVII